MSDLIGAVVIQAVVSVLIFASTIRLTRGLSKGMTTGIGVIAGLLLLLYLTQLWGHPRLAKLLPFSSLVVLGNWFPPATAFLAGITWTHGYGSRWRRLLFGFACFAISMYSVIDPLLGQPPVCQNEWTERGTCLQTTMQSCSAAAAATLLRRHGIATSEAEMAELCLTRGGDRSRNEGTTWQGLYRGLKLKTAHANFAIDVFDSSFDDLIRDFTGPSIIFVGVPKDQPHPRSYTEEMGWTPGVRHSVVLLDVLPNSMLLVADSASGVEVWSIDELRFLWLGRGIRLNRLDEPPASAPESESRSNSPT